MRTFYVCPVVSSIFYLFFFPRLISGVADWMSTILPHMVWPECKFQMQLWNLLHAARWKYRTQKVASAHILVLSKILISYLLKTNKAEKSKTCSGLASNAFFLHSRRLGHFVRHRNLCVSAPLDALSLGYIEFWLCLSHTRAVLKTTTKVNAKGQHLTHRHP